MRQIDDPKTRREFPQRDADPKPHSKSCRRVFFDQIRVLISFLQRLRLIQTPQHHAKHHTDPKNSAYCVLTNFLNPALDSIRFWDVLERMIWVLFRLRRRVDTSVASTPAAREHNQRPLNGGRLPILSRPRPFMLYKKGSN